MVMRILILALATTGCSLLNAGSTHTENFGRDGGAPAVDAPLFDAGPALDASDAGLDAAFDGGTLDGGIFDGGPDAPTDAGTDAAFDAPLGPPILRIVHMARDNGPVDVLADSVPLAVDLEFTDPFTPIEAPEGTLSFSVTRDSGAETLVTQDLTLERGRQYTLVFYGDEIDAPTFPSDPTEIARGLGLLLLDDENVPLDPTTEFALTVVHVASPVIRGQLVAVRPPPMSDLRLVTGFGFLAVAPVGPLPSTSYVLGFDAGGEGVVDVIFNVPRLVAGTYANVFVGARSDETVFLLVQFRGGEVVTLEGGPPP